MVQEFSREIRKLIVMESHPLSPRALKFEILTQTNNVFTLLGILSCSLAYILIGDHVPLHVTTPPFREETGEIDMSLYHDFVTLENVTISDSILLLSSIVIPFAILFIYSIFVATAQNDSFSIFSTFTIAIGLGEGTTAGLKKFVGRLRPNFYKMCEFNFETRECDAPSASVIQSRKSFPSGHSSMSFCAWIVVVLYLFGKIEITSGRGGIGKKRVQALCVISFLSVPVYVAASRIRDLWHFPSDVLAGAAIGIVSATLSYHLFFPHVFHKVSAFPLSQVLKNRDDK